MTWKNTIRQIGDKMPEIDLKLEDKVLDTFMSLITLKVNEELELDLKEGKMKFKRVM
jgi:hypothetical protein